LKENNQRSKNRGKDKDRPKHFIDADPNTRHALNLEQTENLGLGACLNRTFRRKNISMKKFSKTYFVYRGLQEFRSKKFLG
jgi:hypothetical protein